MYLPLFFATDLAMSARQASAACAQILDKVSVMIALRIQHTEDVLHIETRLMPGEFFWCIVVLTNPCTPVNASVCSGPLLAV